MKIVTGKRYLGGFIGDKTTMKEFVPEKSKNWQAKIQLLSAAANSCPHESFSVFTKSVQAEWNFLMRVVPGCDEFLKPLEDSIKNQFISTVTNIYNVSNPQRTLFSLSAKNGRLGIPDPKVKTSEQFEMSKKTSSLISDSIVNGTVLDVDAHKIHVRSSKQTFQLENESQQNNTYKALLEQACSSERKRMERNFKTGNSCWLTAKVSERDNFVLSKNEFQDSMALRYGLPLTNLPVKCDGCGEDFHVQHALICKKGGLITQRHNEIRDLLGDLSCLAWTSLKKNQ